MSTVFLVAAILAPGLRPPLVHGEEFLPLWIGNRWEYRGTHGASETQLVTGTVSIWGTQTMVIDYKASTNNEGLENYWTAEDDGDVLLWGWFRDLQGIGILYQPAIRAVDAPLYVGKTWSDSIAVYLLPDTLYIGTFLIPRRVHEAVMLTVPAGTFFAFGIGQTADAPPPELAGYSLTGAVMEASGRGGAMEWYSDGVGQVQYDADDLYQLAFYTQTTPVPRTTWGRMKSLFHVGGRQ